MRITRGDLDITYNTLKQVSKNLRRRKVNPVISNLLAREVNSVANLIGEQLDKRRKRR